MGYRWCIGRTCGRVSELSDLIIFFARFHTVRSRSGPPSAFGPFAALARRAACFRAFLSHQTSL